MGLVVALEGSVDLGGRVRSTERGAKQFVTRLGVRVHLCF
jgi:hypothetical protein